MGLKEMFSLKAVKRGTLVSRCSACGKSGSVSDLISFLLPVHVLLLALMSRVVECLRVEKVGVGSRDGGKLLLVCDGRRACDLDCWSLLVDFFARVGKGRLLKVLLLGIPPMGSSGRQM